MNFKYKISAIDLDYKCNLGIDYTYKIGNTQVISINSRVQLYILGMGSLAIQIQNPNFFSTFWRPP